ncbi:aldehyde dehydrogenase [Streptomyces sp. NBC_01795]|uniref:aldehyde dehydrogenase n=1 Tax=unclassified Streptomyces TaxID=2593676 RepID=UPI002DDA5FD8|nr:MULTISPECIES: aldehyde dehydrogenase [unclassified Streptomyces]WSA90619.1 aldehyde dehydrogenase [Streptomyces sp. NBC_01795]WSB74946.1 aldehyde dehydrogenase [Streptomyces sp. NBC_01775]WSS16773.1 aldehyde dehydrogenase [Streptomyces sp. NBC_01186]
MVWEGRHDRLFIGGQWIPANGEHLEVISPFTEEVLAEVPSAAASDIDRAVAAARDAFDNGPWPRMPLEARMSALRELGRLIADRQEPIARLITEEMGCPITQSRAIQALNPVRVIDACLDLAPDYPFRSVRASGAANALVTREPVGVVAAVVPWNVPMGISVQKIVPAVLAGCTVVLKPAPQTPLDAYVLGELIEKAGFPPGVVNIVPAERESSEYLVSHPGVDKVSFTGSTAAGRRIAALCGHDLRRVTLELGGKSAAIVLDDADLDQVAEALRLGAFRNNGQVCTLKTRVLVSAGREAELVQRLKTLIDSMPVGDPHDVATQIGPLFSSRQRETVERYIASGREEGATLVTGGGRPEGLDRGWFVEPTLFTGVQNDMTIAREEIFGPVLAVMTYRDEAEALEIANDSPYGLNGAVFTSDHDHGLELASRMRTGVVELNGHPVGLRAPFGGFKASGIGRENGPEGLDAYTEPRSIGLPPAIAASLA